MPPSTTTTVLYCVPPPQTITPSLLRRPGRAAAPPPSAFVCRPSPVLSPPCSRTAAGLHVAPPPVPPSVTHHPRGISSSCRPPRATAPPSAEVPPPAAVRLGHRSRLLRSPPPLDPASSTPPAPDAPSPLPRADTTSSASNRRLLRPCATAARAPAAAPLAMCHCRPCLLRPPLFWPFLTSLLSLFRPSPRQVSSTPQSLCSGGQSWLSTNELILAITERNNYGQCLCDLIFDIVFR
jgi:hypothetical protein